MPFTNGNISLNPINMLKRSALNTGVKSLISGGAIAPLALGAGAIHSNDGGNGSTGSTGSTGSKNSQGMTSSQHSAFRMARGGIASL